jgi:rhomboid protease GluP
MRYPLTALLIALNVVIYLFTALQSGNFVDIPLRTLAQDGALYGPLVVFGGEWWRLLGAMFLHGGMTHVLMNMVSLYIVGRGAELYFSKSAYLALYLFSGLIGGMASLYAHPDDIAMGASGAIFGIFGALAGFFFAHRRRLASHAKEMFQDFATVIVLNFALGMAVPSIDMSAHIGGLLTGFVGGYWLAKRPDHLLFFIGTMVALLAVCVTILQEHYATLFAPIGGVLAL